MGQTQRVTGRATSVRTDDTGTHVRYHATDVVSFNAAAVTLRSGGWMTVTTKLRMNQAANQYRLGYQVYQRNNVWWVKDGDNVIPFVDGMVLDRVYAGA